MDRFYLLSPEQRKDTLALYKSQENIYKSQENIAKSEQIISENRKTEGMTPRQKLQHEYLSGVREVYGGVRDSLFGGGQSSPVASLSFDTDTRTPLKLTNAAAKTDSSALGTPPSAAPATNGGSTGSTNGGSQKQMTLADATTIDATPSSGTNTNDGSTGSAPVANTNTNPSVSAVAATAAVDTGTGVAEIGKVGATPPSGTDPRSADNTDADAELGKDANAHGLIVGDYPINTIKGDDIIDGDDYEAIAQTFVQFLDSNFDSQSSEQPSKELAIQVLRFISCTLSEDSYMDELMDKFPGEAHLAKIVRFFVRFNWIQMDDGLDPVVYNTMGWKQVKEFMMKQYIPHITNGKTTVHYRHENKLYPVVIDSASKNDIGECAVSFQFQGQTVETDLWPIQLVSF